MNESSTPAKILIVDDEPGILMAIEFLMQKNGYVTETAVDGQDALKKLEHFHPDAIILDVMMPNMDGFEFAQEVRKDETYFDTKILFLTAKGTGRDKMQGYGSGGDSYLTKPFDNEALVEMVQEMLEFS